MDGEFCKFTQVYSTIQEELIRNEFSRLEGDHYLDHAGATLYSEKQIQNVYAELSKNLYANPHARNVPSKLTEDAIDVVRFEILSHFRTSPEEYSVIFTAGATAALKLIAECFDYGNEGVFAHMEDNHTSALGMREYANKIIPVRRFDELTTTTTTTTTTTHRTGEGNSLFVYPAQSNFAGTKYPLSWIEMLKRTQPNWFVALDAASFAATSRLDLERYKPDFVALSFYKMFGYPTGLGAVLMRNSSAYLLRKRYFGGGTVAMALARQRVTIPREGLQERFEDGTVSFLSILALNQAFKTLERLKLNIDLISRHTFALAQYTYRNLLVLHHSNGRPVAALYAHTDFEDGDRQGPIVNFNLLRPDGTYFGYSEVAYMASSYRIHLRTGCSCNPGACQNFLKLSRADVESHFQAGHVCGDDRDLVDGAPTGSVRVSFGYMSTKQDADALLNMIKSSFIDSPTIRRNLQIADQVKPNTTINNHHFEKDQKTFHGTLTQIFLYPIKSCGAFSTATKWKLAETGLKYDRLWMIINSSTGVAITQKNNRKLCLIKPIINDKNKELKLTFPGTRDFSLPLDCTSSDEFFCQSKVCGDRVRGWDCGEQVAAWLVDVLNCPGLRLIKQSDDSSRIGGKPTEKCGRGHVALSLANKAQFLMVNSASVEWLRSKIDDSDLKEDSNATIMRFRPNFVVDFGEAFVENHFERLQIGQVAFKNEGKCTRCQMICVNQSTGDFSKQPLQTLAREFKGKITFGIYLSRIEINLNDALFVGCKVTPINSL